MRGAVERAEQMVAAEPGRYVMLQQFKNPANPAIHFKTTGPEIWDDTGGQVDVLVAGIGTGGTITGIARYIKHHLKKDVLTVGVEPTDSPVIAQQLAGEPLQPGYHRIQGIGAGFVPDVLDLSLIDPRRACRQRRSDRLRPPPGSRRRIAVGHLVRRGGGGRVPSGQRPQVQR